MAQQSEVAVLRFSLLLRVLEPPALLLSLSKCLAMAEAVDENFRPANCEVGWEPQGLHSVTYLL